MRNRLDIPVTKVKRRCGTANNLPGARAAKPGWKHPVMALAKVVAWQVAVEKAGSEDFLVDTTDWRSSGITGKLLFDYVVRLVPDFLEVCRRQYPQWDNSEIGRQLSNRLWYMYRRRKNGKVLQCITREHPQSSERLRPYVSQAIRIVHQDKPFKFEREVVCK